MRFKILGKYWNLMPVSRISEHKDYHIVGQAEQTPGKPRVIKILSRLKGQDRLETIVHELTHAASWPLDETFIETFAVDVARVLWRLGYRQIDEVVAAEKARKGDAAT